MLDIGSFRAKTCSGLSRRSFLKLGASAPVALGLSELGSDVLAAEVGRAKMKVEEMMEFKIGTVIGLNKSVNDELIVRVEDVPKFKGLPGHYKGNQAIKLTRVIE